MKSFLGTGSVGRLAGFWACCCQACFSYLGAEMLGITANEVERPRETIPKAVRRVSKRLVFYYVGTIFVLGLNLSSKDPVLSYYVNNPAGNYQGPFVLMAQRANIPGLDHLLNGIALLSTLSLANANLYVSVNPFAK
jgi:amino acid transporter